jgi:hypothetical protein
LQTPQMYGVFYILPNQTVKRRMDILKNLIKQAMPPQIVGSQSAGSKQVEPPKTVGSQSVGSKQVEPPKTVGSQSVGSKQVEPFHEMDTRTPPPQKTAFERDKTAYNKPKVTFDKNWNNKLFNKYFLHFAPHSTAKFVQGDLHEIIFFDRKTNTTKLIGLVQVVTIKQMLLSETTEYIAHTVLGMPLQSFRTTITNMCRKNYPNTETQKFDLIEYKYQSVTESWQALERANLF